MILFLCSNLATAEIIIISGDTNYTIANPDNVEPALITEPNTTLTRSDFDKLVRLSQGIEQSNENVLQALLLIAATIEFQNSTNNAYQKAITDMSKIITETQTELFETKRSNNALSNQIEKMQVDLGNYKATYFSSSILLFIIGFLVAKAYQKFVVRGKMWLIKAFINKYNPLRIPLPDPSKAKFNFKKEKFDHG